MGSPSSVIMLGLGNGTFDGSPSLVVTLGYGSVTSALIGNWSDTLELVRSAPLTMTAARKPLELHRREALTCKQ